MNRTQTPQLIASCIAILLLIAQALTGFDNITYLCMAFVALFFSAALILDYDAWLERKKEERLNQEAIRMLVKDDERRIWLRIRLIDGWEELI